MFHFHDGRKGRPPYTNPANSLPGTLQQWLLAVQTFWSPLMKKGILTFLRRFNQHAILKESLINLQVVFMRRHQHLNGQKKTR